MTDSRDSSASRDAVGSGGGGGEEDGGLLSVTAGLAEEAANLFQSRKYSECIDILQQLSQKKKDDPKVLHNVVVAEYYRDGCSDPRRVLELLNKVKKRSEEVARASGEQVGALSNHGNAISGSKGSGTTHHQLSASNTSIPYIDEYDTSVATLNIAVVLFHLHEHSSALSILDQLFRNRNIERIDETVALHMCLLLLDVALASHDATTAADVLQYVDKAFGYMIGQSETGTTSHPQYSHPPVKTTTSTPTHSNSTSLDITQDENPLSRTYSDEHYETFLSRLDTGDQNLNIPPTDMSKPPPDPSFPSLPSSDLKLKLYLYKVRLLILTRNLKSAKRELKNIMEFARDSPTALLLKSQLEYTRGNYRKSIKLLTTANSRTESGLPSIFNNDLGCIYHQLNKNNSSSVLFLKSLKTSPTSETLYNCGLEYLISGKPVLAAKCFQKAGLVFYNKPLLWLRIAECCISAIQKGEVKVHVAGQGKWRQVIIDEEQEQENKSKLSIPFARQCLVNSLHLLNSFESKPEIANGDTNSTKDSNLTVGLDSSVRMFKEIQKSENNLIKQAVLVNLAYVELSLENPLKALTSARQVLRLPECSRRYTFLARMYMAEALCRLNREKEAAESLSVYLSDGITLEAPYNEEDSEQAVGVLYVNIAVMFALRGDYDQAERYAGKGVELLPENHQAVLTAVYVDLLMGKSKEAIGRLKECNRVRFVPVVIG